MSKELKAPTWYANIWIAGDYAQAVGACRAFCWEGCCVTVTPCAYVYTGGMEDGVCVRLINYPRFPKSEEELESQARRCAEHLMTALCQWSYCIETPKTTTWASIRPEDNKP